MRPFVEREDGFLYEQIATVISTMVANETLAPGDALPSVREISRSRDVSISTAVKAYRLLEDRGLVEARPKSGFYVREVRRRPIAEPTMTRPPRDDADTLHSMRAHVGDVFPEGTRVSNPQGGFLLWIELPNGIDAMRLWQKAMRENISIAPGLLFSCCEAYDDCIRLNGGLCWNEETRTALGTLGRLVRDLEPAPAGDGAARGQPTSNGAR